MSYAYTEELTFVDGFADFLEMEERREGREIDESDEDDEDEWRTIARYVRGLFQASI